MANVYKWPPVAWQASRWSFDLPVSTSRSRITGARYVSAFEQKRRVASLRIAGLSGERAAAGYLENLRILLDGGVSLVRLNSTPVNWHLDELRLEASRRSELINWTEGGVDVKWTEGGVDVSLYSGALLQGAPATDGVWPAATVTGLPANILVARPGEFLTVDGELARVMTVAYSDETGAATIRLMEAIESAGLVQIGTKESAVFEVTSFSDPMQPVSGNWAYDLSFHEVFEAETPGGFVEVDPWS